jgi:hypothetical protein
MMAINWEFKSKKERKNGRTRIIVMIIIIIMMIDVICFRIGGFVGLYKVAVLCMEVVSQ